jgi:hypothetical protein
MRTGVSYMGQHEARYIDLDFREMSELRVDDVLLAVQENDFHYFPGKIVFTPKIAMEHGIRPIAIFWGALNLFGGGRSSQFLLENPSGFQVLKDGSHSPAGCYMNRLCRSRIKEMIDVVAADGFAGYFVDEPTPLRDCFCPSCRAKYEEWYGEGLRDATAARREEFRQRCVVEYVEEVSRYCKESHPHLETICCLMPHDEGMWTSISAIPFLDNFGCDMYWVNDDRDVEKMAPAIRAMGSMCRRQGKVHHQWLQCWDVREGKEPRIFDQGRIILREKPDALYVWAWKGQAGTAESCADPAKAWQQADRILRMAKEQ